MQCQRICPATGVRDANDALAEFVGVGTNAPDPPLTVICISEPFRGKVTELDGLKIRLPSARTEVQSKPV